MTISLNKLSNEYERSSRKTVTYLFKKILPPPRAAAPNKKGPANRCFQMGFCTT